MKKYSFLIHTFLMSVYPILFLLAHNLRFVRVEDSYRSLAMSLSMTVIFLMSFGLILHNWEKAGAICTLTNILFFSFGHTLTLLNQWIPNPNDDVTSTQLGWLWLVIFLAGLYLLVTKEFSKVLTSTLNLFNIILFLFPVGTLIFFKVQIPESGKLLGPSFAELRRQEQAESELSVLSQNEKPDIYYLILDSYERADLLFDLYGYDNDGFLRALEDRGFYILSGSRSNYLNTTYSLNTSLNLIYLHELSTKDMINALSNLKNNYVSDFLHNQGYQIVVFQSGTGDTDKQYADVFVVSDKLQNLKRSPIRPFEQLLLKTTMGVMLLPNDSGDHQLASNQIVSSIDRSLDNRRERISHTFEHLADYAAEPDPHYLFAHIYLPHIPFLYGPDGIPLKYEDNLNAYWYEPKPEDYDQYYAYQIEYLNKAVLAAVDQILARSTKPVVIVLQADHGDGNYLDPQNITSSGVDARSAILNAIYFSDQDYAGFYPTLTPVNTFRVIFNHWFGTSYPILQDRVFVNEHPSEITPNRKPKIWDGCQDFDICLP